MILSVANILECSSTSLPMTPDLAIRARRAAFNRATADADAAAIGPILARNCVMVTGTDSAVIAGRNRN